MEHALDRPIWSALTGPQAHIAYGDARAWRIDPAIGMFAAAATPSPGDAEALVALLPTDAPLILFEDGPWPSPGPGVTATADVMVQMVADAIEPPGAGPPIMPLGEEDAAAMLELATLTRPGPFLARTHQLGGFVGIREERRLVAMAGTRLRPKGFIEVSAVCTHPTHRARGHGARLIRAVAQSILASGHQPYLHAFASNSAAIALYERLGFRTRRHLTMSMLTAKTPAA